MENGSGNRVCPRTSRSFQTRPPSVRRRPCFSNCVADLNRVDMRRSWIAPVVWSCASLRNLDPGAFVLPSIPQQTRESDSTMDVLWSRKCQCDIEFSAAVYTQRCCSGAELHSYRGRRVVCWSCGLICNCLLYTSPSPRD